MMSLCRVLSVPVVLGVVCRLPGAVSRTEASFSFCILHSQRLEFIKYLEIAFSLVAFNIIGMSRKKVALGRGVVLTTHTDVSKG